MRLDLIQIQYAPGKRAMMLCMSNETAFRGTDLIISKNSFGPMSRLLHKEYPEIYPTDDSAIMILTAHHFRALSLGSNIAGQDYPWILDMPTLEVLPEGTELTFKYEAPPFPTT